MESWKEALALLKHNMHVHVAAEKTNINDANKIETFIKFLWNYSRYQDCILTIHTHTKTRKPCPLFKHSKAKYKTIEAVETNQAVGRAISRLSPKYICRQLFLQKFMLRFNQIKPNNDHWNKSKYEDWKIQCKKIVKTMTANTSLQLIVLINNSFSSKSRLLYQSALETQTRMKGLKKLQRYRPKKLSACECVCACTCKKHI